MTPIMVRPQYETAIPDRDPTGQPRGYSWNQLFGSEPKTDHFWQKPHDSAPRRHTQPNDTDHELRGDRVVFPSFSGSTGFR